MHGITDALFRLDLTGLLRAGVIIVGLAIAILGYLTGTISQRLAFRNEASSNANSLFETITAPK